jgi:hypothetical protein
LAASSRNKIHGHALSHTPSRQIAEEKSFSMAGQRKSKEPVKKEKKFFAKA